MTTKKKSAVDRDVLIGMYKQMCLFRRFEERVGLAYTKQKFSGFCHLHIGQEGLAVGVQTALRDYRLYDQRLSFAYPGDRQGYCAWRGHG